MLANFCTGVFFVSNTSTIQSMSQILLMRGTFAVFFLVRVGAERHIMSTSHKSVFRNNKKGTWQASSDVRDSAALHYITLHLPKGNDPSLQWNWLRFSHFSYVFLLCFASSVTVSIQLVTTNWLKKKRVTSSPFQIYHSTPFSLIRYRASRQADTTGQLDSEHSCWLLP